MTHEEIMGEFEQWMKREVALKDSKIKLNSKYKYSFVTIVKYTGTTKDPANNGPVHEYLASKNYRGRRFPQFITRPDLFCSEIVNKSVTAISTGGNQTVEFSVSHDPHWWSPSAKTRLLVLKPNSRINIDDEKGFFELTEGTLLEDTKFKTAREFDDVMEFYTCGAEGVGGLIKKEVDALKKLNPDKDKLADSAINAFTVKQGIFTAMTGAVPSWFLPADYAFDFAKNLIKSYLAYALSYCYFGKVPNDLKNDLYILLADDDVKSTVEKVLEVVKKVDEIVIDIISDDKLMAKLSEASARKAAKDLAKGKIVKSGEKKITAAGLNETAKAAPFIATGIQMALDTAEIQKYGSATKWYYKMKSGNASAAPGPVAKKVTVSFDANGGSAPNPAKKEITVGEAYGPLPPVSKSGYTFNGWYVSVSGGTLIGPSTKVTNASDHKLYALWGTPSGMAVTFNANGGSAPDPATKHLSPGNPYGTLPNVSRGSCKFEGWFTEANGGTKVDEKTVFDGSKRTLYAHWAGVPMTVNFNGNGGSVPNPEKKSAFSGSAYGSLPTVTKPGYKFDGWFTEANGGTKVESSTYIAYANNHALYAHWTAKTYAVNYDTNGSSAIPAKQGVKWDDKNLLPGNPAKAGFTFGGWNVSSGGSGTNVSNSKAFKDLATNDSVSSITLKAQWTANVSTPTPQPQPKPQPQPAPKPDYSAYQSQIQGICKFHDPSGVWNVIEQHSDPNALYKKLAETLSRDRTRDNLNDSFYKKFAEALSGKGSRVEYKEIIQTICKFPEPSGVWAVLDRHGYADDFYRKLAQSLAGKSDIPVASNSNVGTTWKVIDVSNIYGKQEYIFAIAYGKDKFVAGGNNGKMAISTDGVRWTALDASKIFGENAIRAIAYGNNKFVAGGDNGKMATSTDGTTWTAVADSRFGTSGIEAIAYGKEKFVAVGNDAKMATSTDGIAWKAVDVSRIFVKKEICTIAYCKDKFIAGGRGNKMATSTDGTTWTAIDASSIFSDERSFILAIAYGNNKFIAGGNLSKMANSSDGITWKAVDTSSIFSETNYYMINNIAYGNGTFIAWTSEYQMATSTDGTAWTAVSDDKFYKLLINAIAYGNNKFVAVGFDLGNASVAKIVCST